MIARFKRRSRLTHPLTVTRKRDRKINFGLTQVLRYQSRCTRTRFTSDKPAPQGGFHIAGIDPGEAVNRVLRRGNLLICSEGIGGSPHLGVTTGRVIFVA